ncbi:hypothetical protein WJX77_012513 [Trebouxia sp. C0004]
MPFEHIEQRNVPVIESFQGFRPAPHKRTLFSVSVICSLGATWLLTKVAPEAALYLTLEPCPPSDAAFVLAKLGDGGKVFCKVEKSHQKPSTAWWRQTTHQSASGHATCLLVRIRGDAYAYSGVSGAFTRVPRMPVELPDQLKQAQQALAAINQDGGTWESFNPVGSWPRKQRVLIYGSNQVPVSWPRLSAIATPLLQNPLLIIQSAELLLWMYAFQYYLYPIALFGIMLFGSGASGYLQYRQRMRLVALLTKRQLVPVLYKKFVRALLAKQLVPGDVIVVRKGRAACDMVMLWGKCLVEESMLSGEASQVRKSSHAAGVCYDPDIHRSATVHAGSWVQQVWVDDDDDQAEALAMVVRTGVYTTTGNMLRPLNYSKTKAWNAQWRDPDSKDAAMFLLLSLTVNMIIYISFLPYIVKFQLGSATALLQLLGVVLNALPPLLACCLIILRAVTVMRLRRQSVFVSDTQKLQTAAQLDLVLFDKTGTLTMGEGSLHGVLPCEDCTMGGLKMEPIAWSSGMRKSIALCNDLVPVGSRNVTGHADERKAFTDVEAAFLGRNTICLPVRQHPAEPARFVTLDVLHRFEFDADHMMSGVVARGAPPGKEGEEPEVFLKGSPHAVIQLVAHNRLPENWAPVMLSWAAMGYRVMGVVCGKASVSKKQDLAKLSLANIKDHMRDVRLLGFMVISNPVRSESGSTIAELQKKGRIRTMMVTGDHYMTASAVAYSLGILEKGGKGVVLDMMSAKSASEAPTKGPQHVSKSDAAVASHFGGTQHSREDLSQAALRHSVAQHSRLMAASIPHSRVSFRDEDSGLAAVRASLQESLRAPSASPTAAAAQQAAAVSAAANTCQLSSRSFPCAPAVHAADAAASPAAAIAASSALFRSSSLQAASPPPAAAAAAATSAASPAAVKAPSPLLASYLQSMGLAKSAPQAQAGSAEAQPASAQAQQVSARATPLHAQSRFADRMPGLSVQSTNEGLALAQLSRLDQHQLPADSHPTSLPQATAPSTLSHGEYRQQMIGVHDLDNDRISMDSSYPLLSAESHRTAGSNSHSANESQLAPSSMSKTQVEDVRLSINLTQPHAAHCDSKFQLATQSQISEQTWAGPRNGARGESQAQGKIPNHSLGMTHAQADKDRDRTSFELRKWAREQGKSQPQSRAVSAIQSSLEIKASTRTRSLDLLRADVKNIRLSVESARLPQGEKMLCMSVEGGMMQVITSKDAFKMIAEGAQSTITGFAFDHMLKEVDSDTVEMVVRSAGVLARMKAHQKAQLVLLLSKGLQVSDDRHLKGLGHTVAYCGDGINDIAALHAADLGIAIGATEAVVAAPVSTPVESVSVVCTLIKEARCSVMISFYLFKYLVLHGFVESVVGAVAFFAAYTNLTNAQYETLDFTALVLALAAVCTLPSGQLHDRMPAGRLMSLPVLAPLVLLGCCYGAQQGMAVAFVSMQSWYQSGHDPTPAVATSILIGLFQLLLPAFAFFNDMRSHVLGFRHNPQVPAVMCLIALFWGIWDVVGKGLLADVIELNTLPTQFRPAACYLTPNAAG